MKIDIDKLTGAELIDLNNRVVTRLRFIASVWAWLCHASLIRIVSPSL